jgi:alpha-amylase/alpha-mannosidase (GH57 family)
MLVTIHGHFYQPPREDPWTGRIPCQPGAAPYHDWNEKIAAECYAPNARSRILDEQGRIEEIVSTYDWMNFDFGPTLLSWLETEMPEIHAEIVRADQRSRARCDGHGNAIAQVYSHAILPLANYRDKRTQVLWGLRDFEHRFGRPSESIWLAETAVDLETLRVLLEFGMRYLILSPGQAKRIRPMAGGPWSDVGGGRIDPRRAYYWRAPGEPGKGIAVFFYDGPIAVGISFEHLLRNASTFADRLQIAGRGAGPESLVHAATDGEVYGHHEPFGDMCLAYLARREGLLRGMGFTNYGHYLDLHPAKWEVEIDFGDSGEGTSWSCAHGVDRWKRDCGCSTGGLPGWNQKWRAPLRRGLDYLQDRLLEVYLAGMTEIVSDPWKARDDLIDVMLGRVDRDRWLEEHARRALTAEERRRAWSLLEAQRNAMYMYASCAWFFADISGIEVQQAFGYAARAIELAQPFSRSGLEQGFMGHLADARSNLPAMGTGADVWTRFTRPMRRPPSAIAIEATGLLAAGQNGMEASSPAFAIHVESSTGNLRGGGIQARIRVTDRATEEIHSYDVEARPDPGDLMRIQVRNETAGIEEVRGIDDLPYEVKLRVVRALLADTLAQDESRFDEIFETSRGLLERYRSLGLEPPPILRALANDAVNRRVAAAARLLEEIPSRDLTGRDLIAITAEIRQLAAAIGVGLVTEPIGRVIVRAIDVNLDHNVQDVGTEAINRTIDLLKAAETAGISIRRTNLEERVYALLSYHRDAVQARLSNRPAPEGGLDVDLLIRLAELSNLSLRMWDRAPAHSV